MVGRLSAECFSAAPTAQKVDLSYRSNPAHSDGPGVSANSSWPYWRVADMECQRIRERIQAGRDKARQSLAASGRTHRGKASLGRPKANDPHTVVQWRFDQRASIAATAKHFGCSTATVKRYYLAAAVT